METSEPVGESKSGEWSLIQRIVARFEQALPRGERPSILEALADAGPVRARALVELIHSELEFRLKAGEPARVEEYIAAFPELNRDRRSLVGLLVTEWAIRRRSEPTLNGDEYQRRFPGLHGALLDEMAHPSSGLRPTLPLVPPAGGGPHLDDATVPLPSSFGRFELREEVGRGTFGRVYRAWDTVMRQQVAVKLPRRGKSASPADVQTFLREARIASGLRHPHIVQMLEAASHEGTAYMVSEFIEGRTLADAIRAGLPRLAESADLMATVLEALHYAHEHPKKVIHRDLKPSNILIDVRGRPHLTDFGLAQRDASEASSMQWAESLLIGTLAYMSPEQALGGSCRVDARSDVFAAGIILYELLTGELPFRGRGRMLQAQIVEAEPTPPRLLNDAIPIPLETICLKALAKAPTERYPTARDMAEDIRRYLLGQRITPLAGSSRWQRFASEVRSRPIRSLAVAYGFVAAMACPVLALALIRSERRMDGLRREVQTLTSAPRPAPSTGRTGWRTDEARDGHAGSAGSIHPRPGRSDVGSR